MGSAWFRFERDQPRRREPVTMNDGEPENTARHDRIVRANLASPHPKPGTKCPSCQGPIPDLFGEMTADPTAVMVAFQGYKKHKPQGPGP